MLGKFEYEVMYGMPRDEFARWCAFLQWENNEDRNTKIRASQLANARK